MAKKESKTAETAATVSETLSTLRPYVLPVLGGTLALLVCLLAMHRMDRFLSTDSRFAMRVPELGVQGSPDLRVAGASRVSMAAVRNVFLNDEGRSVFEIPLAERRQQLRQILWVRDAAVSRIWPNRIDVRLEERVPRAFVHLSPLRRDVATRARLIDEEGVLLLVPEKSNYDVPVITGVREDQAPRERAARVRLMRRFLEEIGKMGDPISEIDVSEPENLKAVYPTSDRAITLILGSEQWRSRVERFLRHWPEIRRKMPGVIKLDLRLTDRITAIEFDKQEIDSPAQPGSELRTLIAREGNGQ